MNVTENHCPNQVLGVISSGEYSFSHLLAFFSSPHTRPEFVYTPKHGSWLNMAEIELNVLTGQCLDRRIDKIETVKDEVAAWQEFRNNKNAKVNWQFTTADARVKLSRLYPTLDS